mmetsp:Transcript_9925/g.14948  ORF Transcript_9925/g.14948 Transcript_9925/m.14948 type:complete len:2471 (-) Transcript_9925:176-7588(-)
MGVSVSQTIDSSDNHWIEFPKSITDIHHRAGVIRKIDWNLLWNNFINSSSASFAVAVPEMISLLEASIRDDEDTSFDINIVKNEIQEYIAFVQETTEPKLKVLDFLAICSSILICSDDHLGTKIDTLFMWIDLNMHNNITLDELYIGVASFERGLSYALGHSPVNEKYLRAVSQQWFSMCGTGRDIDNVPGALLEKSKFVEFCENRQQAVRRLLEAFASARVMVDKTGDLQEVATSAKLSSPSLDEPTGGDEWLASPAWKKTAEIMTPSDHGGNPSKPTSKLHLEWVHGYRGFDCRNNARYVDMKGSVAFTAAALGVVQDTNVHSQKYFGEHTDDIVSISVFEPPDGNWDRCTIATGEMGKKPAIHVWDTSSMLSIACMVGTHTTAVTCIAHSGDGKELFSIGFDRTVAVYCLDRDGENKKRFGKQLCSAKGPPGRVLHACSFGPLGQQYVTCGEKHIGFWKKKGSSLSCTDAPLRRGQANKIYLSACRSSGESVVVGATDGTILLFRNNKASDPVLLGEVELPGSSAVNALWSPPDGNYVIVGSKDGVLYKFEQREKTLQKQGSFPLYEKSTSSPPIRSVCVSPSEEHSRLLVGTQTCELLELEVDVTAELTKMSSKVTMLVQGHWKDELWGLAVRPPLENPPERYKGEFASVGDDGYLRVYSVADHRQINCLDIGNIARCCAYSPDGTMLAVGFGGKGKKRGDGMFRVYRFNYKNSSDHGTMPGGDWITMIHEARDAKQWITDIRFSADGRILAVGSKDNAVYIYSVAKQFKLKFKFSRHNSYITHIDISSDGKYMQSTCGAYELLFCNLDNGKPILKGSTLSTVPWSTWTCPLGWPVQGIWPPGADGTDINAVDRSPSGTLIASADDFGKVKVFRFPSVQENSEFDVYLGHSSHVTNARWVGGHSAKNSRCDSYLITAGGNDKCLFQWRMEHGDDADGSAPAHKKETSSSTEDAFSMNQLEEPSGGDEFMAVKPWKGAIKAPSNFGSPDATRVVQFFAALGEFSTKHGQLHEKQLYDKTMYDTVSRAADHVYDRLTDSGYSSKEMPDNDEMELAWVHGYRGFDCRNNLRYTVPPTSSSETNPDAVYFAANLGIVLTDKDGVRKQRYFRGHTDDVLAMATCICESEGVSDTLVVTGQNAKGNSYVWSATTMELKATFQTKQKTIRMLQFCGKGRLVMSLGEDATVVITDWANQRIIASADFKGAAATFDIASSSDNHNLFFTTGDDSMLVWSLEGRNLTSTKISTSKLRRGQKYLCVALFGGEWVVGGEDGDIYVIQMGAKKVGRVISHSQAAEAIVKTPEAGKKRAGKGKRGSKKTGGAKSKRPAVTSIFCAGDFLLTGAIDGSVALWGSGLARIGDFSIDSVFGASTFVGTQVRSLSCIGTIEDCKILIGTRGCDILEVQYTDGSVRGTPRSPLVRGHCLHELWGLAVHPFRPEYTTVGDDKTLRVWNAHSKKMMVWKNIDTMARACAYHSSGNFLAVGFGGRVGRMRQKADGGVVRIYSYSTSSSDQIQKLYETKDSKRWISDVKFSPDGCTLAAGSHDNNIYIYNFVVGDDQKPSLEIRGKFSRHNSYITHFDFSSDSRFMQSNCGAYELLFCDSSTGKHITSASELRDVRWDTWTCTLGWPVQGIWPAGADGTDINAVDRSHSGHLVAACDDFGNVRVLKYPCVEEGASALTCAGHSSHVMNVKWTVADEYLISCGGNDKAVFQWKHMVTTTSTGGSSGAAAVVDSDSEDEALDLLEEPTGGDEFMAVKPWRGAIRAPDNPPPISASPPAAQLELNWVHGYTSGAAGKHNSRISSNLFYNCEGDVIYPAAALGVCLHHDSDTSEKCTQKYFKGHDDDVLCLTISSCKRYVATGQTASKAMKGSGSVCVWDAVDCRLLSEMKSCHKRGVVSLCFNPDGDKLISVGLDNDHLHTVWHDTGGSWSSVQKIVSKKSSGDVHLYTRWIANPASEYSFVSGGTSKVHFWKIEGSALSSRESRLGKHKAVDILCAANLIMKDNEYRLVTGTASGDLYVFGDDRVCENVIEQAHASKVLTLAEGLDHKFIVSGGVDKCVKIWNQALQAITYFKFEQDLAVSPVNASVASVDYRLDESNNIIVLVGTYGGEVIEVCAGVSEHTSKAKESAGDINFDIMSSKIRVLMQSHYKGELWGLAPHPKNPDLVATAGDDGTVRVWSISRNIMIECFNCEKAVRCVCWHPDGEILAVGLHELQKGGGRVRKHKKKKAKKREKDSGPNGCCFVFSFSSANKLEMLASGCPSTAWISDIKFSPDGRTLALGSHDKRLYAYDAPDPFAPPAEWADMFSKPAFVFNKHSSAITHFDFSLDGKFFQSNCQAYELLFGFASGKSRGKQKTSASELKNYNAIDNGDEQWATWTCSLGWPVQGIWQEGADGSDINAVDRSPTGTMVATADDSGLVKLFRYPCVEDGAKYLDYTGHSSHVTNVRWASSDYIVSAGGNDKCLFVWRVSN